MTYNLRIRLLLFLLLVGFFLAGLVILPVPFTRDQGIYAYNAWMWLADSVPYRDTFGHKGPSLYAVYAVALDMSAGAFWGVNLFDLLSRTATVLFTFLLARDLFGKRAGLYASFFAALPLFGIFNSCWWNGQAETFMIPLITASAWLCVRRPETGGNFLCLLSGFLMGQACAMKTNAVFIAVFLFFWLMIYGGERGVSPKRGLCYLAGGIMAALLWAAYFLGKGALYELYECLFLFNSFHLESALSLSGPGPALVFGRGLTVFSGLVLFLVFFPLRRGEAKGSMAFAVFFLLFALASVAIQLRFFLYHFLLVIPAMAIATGRGADVIHEWLNSLRFRAALVFVVLVVGLSLFHYGKSWYLITLSYRTFDYIGGRIERAGYYSRFSEDNKEGVGDFNLLATAAVSSYIREHTDEDAEVLVFGYEPLVNYLSGRPAPTRFEIDYPLTFQPLSERAEETRQRWRSQFMTELQNRPPRFVVLVDNDLNAIEMETSKVQAAMFEQFWTWLNKNYEKSDTIEDFSFYEKR